MLTRFQYSKIISNVKNEKQNKIRLKLVALQLCFSFSVI